MIEIAKFSILYKKRDAQFWMKIEQKVSNWSPKYVKVL